jgi:hypothetical protein
MDPCPWNRICRAWSETVPVLYNATRRPVHVQVGATTAPLPRVRVPRIIDRIDPADCAGRNEMTFTLAASDTPT